MKITHEELIDILYLAIHLAKVDQDFSSPEKQALQNIIAFSGLSDSEIMSQMKAFESVEIVTARLKSKKAKTVLIYKSITHCVNNSFI